MSGKLTQSEINKYGFYTLAAGLGNAVPMSYILVMTDHLMISGGSRYSLLIARILDFAVSLAAGPIVQRSNLKWGKYRSWLIILRWVTFIGVCLQFVNTSSLPLPVRLVIVAVGYCMLHFYELYYISANGLLYQWRYVDGRQNKTCCLIYPGFNHWDIIVQPRCTLNQLFYSNCRCCQRHLLVANHLV